jgi:hypothetical protein
MPITNISIENFKGIGKRVDIPIRPITLLFGANSAGKSTILQALLYLRHVLENSDPSQVNADKLEVSGETIDLGGFGNFVHDQDLNNQIHIAVTVAVDDDGLPCSGSDLEQISSIRPFKEVEEVSVGVTVKDLGGEWCGVSLYEVKINGEYIAKIQEIDSPENCEVEINGFHPAFGDIGEDENLIHPLVNYWLFSDKIKNNKLNIGSRPGGPELFCIPRMGSSFNDYFRGDSDDEDSEAIYYLTQLLIGSCELVHKELKGMRNIGGLREIPDRSYKPGLKQHSEKWYKGIAAWDRFHGDHYDIEPYLNALNRLGLDSRFEVREFLELPNDGIVSSLAYKNKDEEISLDMEESDEVRRELKKARFVQKLIITDEREEVELEPADVGVGISQVLPVVVGAHDKKFTLLSIEQPELHIHPAIQCNLADELVNALFHSDRNTIERESDRVLLLETHSEHLMLRLLRRIRESYEDELPPGVKGLSPESISVVYVERDNQGVKITHLPVTEDGDFEKKWPKGFFEERTEELF